MAIEINTDLKFSTLCDTLKLSSDVLQMRVWIEKLGGVLDVSTKQIYIKVKTETGTYSQSTGLKYGAIHMALNGGLAEPSIMILEAQLRESVVALYNELVDANALIEPSTGIEKLKPFEPLDIAQPEDSDDEILEESAHWYELALSTNGMSKKVYVIKALRALTYWSLKDTKKGVDHIDQGGQILCKGKWNKGALDLAVETMEEYGVICTSVEIEGETGVFGAPTEPVLIPIGTDTVEYEAKYDSEEFDEYDENELAEPKTADPKPKEEAMTLPAVALIDATQVLTPIKGTDANSIYYCVAIGSGVKVAARIRNNRVSIRAEGDVDSVKDNLVAGGLDQSSETHFSMHVTVDDPTLYQKVIGASLFGMGLPFTDVATDMSLLVGQGV